MRKRRLKILLFILLTPIVLLCVFLLFERIRGQISLAHYKRELAAKGEVLDVRKLIAPPVADADNGAPEVLRLKALVKEGQTLTKNPPPNMKLISPGNAMVGFREVSWVNDKVTNTWANVSLDLDTNKQPLELLRAALSKPAFDCRPDYSRGFEM